jgi:HD-GYP domain-containing protein (c-di-GMP phosphodiesterase class II)
MPDPRLEYPVITIDNKQLLPAGTLLSEKTIEILVSGNTNKYKKNILLDYKSIKEDMEEFFHHENYSTIFGDENIRKTIFKIMKKVRLPLPILESIYFFKVYDFYTYRHNLMVFALSTLLAIDLLKDTHNLMEEVISAPTHDFGKISVPLNILRKETPLNKTEKKLLQQHALSGYVLLAYYFQDPKNLAARIARDHHERKDGSGYPSGIRINDQMIEIVMVTDIYDALISPRSYRPKSYDKRTALEEITGMAKNGKINLDIVKALISHNRKKQLQVSECIISKQKRGTPPADNQYGIIVNEDSKIDKT